ncbi:dihydrolipoamide acetyltransferase family protein [Salinigranum marinum]|uniref:dihydrolipoamide acetyltransferase family protein n=1 Tax=Salinigranum marinum TaxID=1515595 RepID=UPI002989B64B|nr:2-oxo acid dehydrogenase subunit E2 [Salinigranum marinum]
MIREFKLPDVGEGVAEGELVAWHVKPGDGVVEDQVVAEVETDKALVEVPSPYDGTVAELRAEAGQMVPVGDVIITFDVPDEAGAEGEAEPESASASASEPETTTGPSDAPAATEPAASGDSAAGAESEGDADHEPDARVFAPPSVRRLAREEGVDLATIDGSGPGGRITEGDVRAAAEAEPGASADAAERDEGPAAVSFGGPSATSGDAAEGGEADDAASGAPTQATEAAGRDRTLAAPATRKLAADEGVDIDDVPATERRDGEAFVTPDAVRAYAEAQRAAQEADAAAVSAGEIGEAGDGEAASREPVAGPPATVETEPVTDGEEDERVPYRGIRRTIGEQMQRSKFTAPHVTHHDTAVVDDLVALRSELKPHAEARGVSLTYTPLVMTAVVKALKEHPKLNAVFDEENEEILRKREYHVGVAVATDAGLMVPVVRDVDRKGAVEIASELGGLVERAHDRSIAREEMRGSTFTITNFGAIGGEYATPIINYPEVAILGLGAIEQRPVVEEGEVVARHTLPLSLSIDHRVVDGADAGRFANTLIEYLENPRLLLL